VIEEAPTQLGAVKETLAALPPQAVADPIVGVPGTACLL
jgi:hypothetical protein